MALRQGGATQEAHYYPHLLFPGLVSVYYRYLKWAYWGI
jgi:hypothetical protein